MKASKLILLSLVATSLLGCKQENVLPDSALVCEEPRPEMCTMDYRPACGTQSSDQKKHTLTRVLHAATQMCSGLLKASVQTNCQVAID
jgi:hypothetical protein